MEEDNFVAVLTSTISHCIGRKDIVPSYQDRSGGGFFFFFFLINPVYRLYTLYNLSVM